MKGSFLFLGTGGSSGTPMIGCNCAVCTSKDTKNKRLRPSALITINGKHLLIDPGPDFRQQALLHGIDRIDGVLITHTHFDHVAGLDELRVYYLLHRVTIPVLASIHTLDDLKRRYDYLFREKSWGISLSAQLQFQVLEGEKGETTFLDIPVRYVSYEQGGMPVNGYRFGNFAYIIDIRHFSETIYKELEGVETLVLGALRSDPSPMHFSLDEAIAFSRRVGAKKTFLTHIAHDLDHAQTNAHLPEGIALGYDGLTLEFNL